MALRWILFPRSERATAALQRLIDCFQACYEEVRSDRRSLQSDAVLRALAPSLREAGFLVEAGKNAADKIAVPVLSGLNGKIDKCFNADAFHPQEGVVVEVEAGRAVDNNQFLKDLFQACMMQDANHVAICVRNHYRGADNFETVRVFFDTLYASHRIKLPLSSILILGY